MKMIISALLILLCPLLAVAQDTLEWRCINGRCGWYRVAHPTFSSPMSIDRPAAIVQQSGIVRQSKYETFTPEPAVSDSRYETFAPEPATPLATGEAAHTPMSEVVRVIGLLPKPEIAFVDFGCGYDARWCVAAAERWKCKCIGIENDPNRAIAARERIRNLGLDRLITIVEGDAGTVPVSGDVAVAYLYPSVLTKLTPRLKRFKAFASYLHQPPGMNCMKNGDTWFYQPQAQLVSVPQSAVWRGAVYNQPLCTSPNCAMCNSIRRQLGLYQ